MSSPATTPLAVVLAAGAGTRMRREAPSAALLPEQVRAAAEGAKAMMPIHGRPFLDYTLHALAEADIHRAIVVRSPQQSSMQRYYEQQTRQRMDVRFAIQAEPRGTAHALLSAREAVQEQAFLLLNGDNGYPIGALKRLSQLSSMGLVAFGAESVLLQPSATDEPDARLCAYAAVYKNPLGELVDIVEKPPVPPDWVSMNCWRMTPEIFRACEAIEPSPRGEWELPDAVRFAMRQHGQSFQVVPARGPVLDLSSRADIQAVSDLLRDVHLHL